MGEKKIITEKERTDTITSEMRKKVERFADILSSIDSLEDKKKHLWKEIYENALIDRENASMLFTSIHGDIVGATNHQMLGQTATKYLERMCKSNDQILRLAELIDKAEQRSERIDPDDVFSKISGDPIILNTSFNLPGEPIVESPFDALNSFNNGALEYLCLGNYLVSRS